MRLPLLGLFLAACGPVTPEIGDSSRHPDDTDTGSDTGDTADTADSGDTGPPVYDCDALVPLPLERAEQLRGFTTAEDFALDGAGQHVSIDANGALVGITQDGTHTLILPGAGFAAGTHMLADGQVVFADVGTNSLVRVDPVAQTSVVIASGLSYPNGLDVGIDGYVYVAETASGTLRRVHAETGESTVVARGLSGANGVSFGPGFTTLYVGSFGGGAVWRLDLGGDGEWSEPVVHALVPGAAAPPPAPCDDEPLGAACSPGGYGIGECVQTQDGFHDCQPVNDTAACDGKVSGDACSTRAFNEPVDSVCVTSSITSETVCAAAPAEYVEPCMGRPGRPCEVGDAAGTCVFSYQGTPVCDLGNYAALMTEGCEGLQVEDECMVKDYAYGYVGMCQDGALWGMEGVVCAPASSTGGQNGGLDALNVDACGNVYASSYSVGKVWRWTAEGAEAELVMDVRAGWIPNMHWGHGVGGWEEDVLYLANRDQGSVFALELGVPGHGEAFDPTP